MQLNQQINYEQYEQDFENNSPKGQSKDISMQTGNQRDRIKDEDASYEESFEKDYQDEVGKERKDEVKEVKQVEGSLSNLNGSPSELSQQFEIAKKKQEELNANKSSMKMASDLHNPNRQKMIEQNIKLKTQIYELAKQMDEIMAREKKQKKYGIHADEQDDQTLKVKKQELKKQQVQIMNLKNKIFITKRQLEHVYDSRGIQGKEDELKNLQKQLKSLQEEKNALNKVKKQQSKALKIIRNDNEYEIKISSLKENISKMKQECRYLSENLVENERVLRKNHETYLTKQAKIKEMEQKIKESKDKSKMKNKKDVTQQNVTAEMVIELEKEIQEIEEQRKEAESSWSQKISTVESELQQKRLDEEKKLLILKDKEKELRLSELRVKQLKKLIQHHQKQISKVKNGPKDNEKEIDSREFRHKRNIKHL